MFHKQYQSKYHNIRQTYNGRSYHSKKEASFAYDLDLRKKAKRSDPLSIKDWQPQIKIPLYVYGELICNYIIDFKIEHWDGSEELVEVKGFETNEWQIKWKLFTTIWSKEHPDIKLTLIK